MHNITQKAKICTKRRLIDIEYYYIFKYLYIKELWWWLRRVIILCYEGRYQMTKNYELTHNIDTSRNTHVAGDFSPAFRLNQIVQTNVLLSEVPEERNLSLNVNAPILEYLYLVQQIEMRRINMWFLWQKIHTFAKL